MEIENEKRAHIKDGVAMTKFIYWKKNTGRIPMDEISVSDYLGKLRMDQEGCIGLRLCNPYPIWSTWSHVPLLRHTGGSIPGPRGLYPH